MKEPKRESDDRKFKLLSGEMTTEQVKEKSFCNGKCLNVSVTVWIGLIMLVWLYVDIRFWNCHLGDGEVGNSKCSATEDWIGDIYGYLVMCIFRTCTKQFILIIFGIALFKINRLLAKLKQFGFVQDTFVIRLHIALTLIQLTALWAAAWSSIYITYKSIRDIDD